MWVIPTCRDRSYARQSVALEASAFIEQQATVWRR
jgi:hypothetical protein